jgi:hypothetical protein
MATQFDPSILSQIPDYAPNPVKAQSDAMALAGQSQGLQMGGLELAEKRQRQQDEAQAREALKGADFSSFDSATRALSKVTSPKIRMDLMAGLQKNQTQKREATLQDMEIADKKLDILAGVLDPVIAQLEPVAQQGMSPAMLDAKTKQLVIPAILQLQNDHPDLQPEIQRFLADPNHLTFAGAKSVDQQTKRGSQALKDRIAQMQANTAARRESAYESDVSSRGRERDQKVSDRESAKLEPEDVKFMAGQYLAGDKSVLTNLGRGTQGAANIVTLRKAIREEANVRGLKPADVAAKMAEFNAIMAEERKIGSIAGAVEFANAEIERFDPLVREASAALPRGSFMPFTKLVQIGERNLSDPALRRLYVQINGYLNAYDVLAARGGSDVGKREHNRAMLTTADSPEVLATAMDAVKQEISAARAAGREAKQTVAAELSDRPNPPPPPGGSSQSKPAWAE